MPIKIGGNMVKKNIFAGKDGRRDDMPRKSPAQAQIKAIRRAMEFGDTIPKEGERLALGTMYRIDMLLKEFEERMDIAAIDMSVQKKIQSDFSEMSLRNIEEFIGQFCALYTKVSWVLPIYRAQILDTDVHTDTMERYKRHLLGHIAEMEHVYTNQVMRMVKRSLQTRLGG